MLTFRLFDPRVREEVSPQSLDHLCIDRLWRKGFYTVANGISSPAAEIDDGPQP